MSLFYPGSTPSHSFVLPYKAEECDIARVTYRQGGKHVLAKEVKTFTPATNDENKTLITILFTQAESLRFDDKKDIFIQINLVSTDRKRYTSEPITLKAGDQYERAVIQSG